MPDQGIPSREIGITLRLTQTCEGNKLYRVEVELEGAQLPRQAALAHFTFKLARQEQEDLRWYFEDYLQNPLDPAPAIAARIEKRMDEMGMDLFQAVLDANTEAKNIWATLHNRVHDTGIEIVSGIGESSAIPWELLQEPQNHTPLALRVRAFVHRRTNPVPLPQPLHPPVGPIRVLLVICRPINEPQPPFRSVAIRIVQSLSGRSDFQLEVLRPPTYNRMVAQLNAARARGTPYHVVHFDGHGTYEASSGGQLRGVLHFEGDKREPPPMRLSDFIPLARSLTQKHGQPSRDVATWWPLLQFTAGNPLTSTVLVKQALDKGLQTAEQIEAFVASLRAGERVIADQASQDRSTSLRASLSYGFEHTFNEQERQRVALLSFFQGFVNTEAERLYQQSSSLRDPGDYLGKSKCLSQLGYVNWARFVEAQAAGEPQEKARSYFNKAEKNYTEAADKLKPSHTLKAVQELATLSAMLGNVYRDDGQLDRPIQYYREAIRLFTDASDFFQAAAVRVNTALALGSAGRFQEAQLFAEAARQTFAETVGDDAAETQKTQQIIEAIKEQLDQKGSDQHDDNQGVQ